MNLNLTHKLDSVPGWGRRFIINQSLIILFYFKFKNAGLLKNKMLKHDVKDTNSLWLEHHGGKINLLWHQAFKNFLGFGDARFIPHNIWWKDILPAFNDYSYLPAFKDKNYSDIFLETKNTVRTPVTLIRRICGLYYDSDYNLVDTNRIKKIILDAHKYQIIKSSVWDNGVGVEKLTVENNEMIFKGISASLKDFEDTYKNDFVIQEALSQCKEMSLPHPSSVNTIRVVTFRWEREIIPLLLFARFGAGGKVTDNAGTGGLCCGIDEHGFLHKTAIDESLKKYCQHPDTSYDFSANNEIPSFRQIIDTAKRLHEKLYHFDLLSWDFAINEQYEPVFIEVNFRGASWIYQMACEKPIFGDLTDKVMRAVKNSDKWKKHKSLITWD